MCSTREQNSILFYNLFTMTKQIETLQHENAYWKSATQDLINRVNYYTELEKALLVKDSQIETLSRDVQSFKRSQQCHHDELSQLKQRNAALERQCNASKEEMGAAKAELAATKDDLAAANAYLTNTRGELAAAKADLESVKADLESVKADRESVKADRESVKADLESVKADLESVKDDLESVKDDLESTATKTRELSCVADSYKLTSERLTMRLRAIERPLVLKANEGSIVFKATDRPSAFKATDRPSALKATDDLPVFRVMLASTKHFDTHPAKADPSVVD